MRGYKFNKDKCKLKRSCIKSCIKNGIESRGIVAFAMVLSFCCTYLAGCGKCDNADITWQMQTESESLETEMQSDLFAEAVSEEQSATSENDMIYVYLCGAVANPDVYEVAAGSRLFEVLEMAGGMTQDADKTYLNLARTVSDGEQIIILTTQETQKMQSDSGAAVVTENIESESGGTSDGLININTASIQELTSISGIGESRAQAIITYREQHGNFNDIEGIKEVDGIKDGLFQKIKDKITVG